MPSTEILFSVNCYYYPDDDVMMIKKQSQGPLWWLSGKEYACQHRGHGFNP